MYFMYAIFNHFKNRNNLIETTPYLFLPSIIALAIPLIIEHNLKGYYAILMAVVGGLFFTTIIGASSISVNKRAPNYYLARIISTLSNRQSQKTNYHTLRFDYSVRINTNGSCTKFRTNINI